MKVTETSGAGPAKSEPIPKPYKQPKLTEYGSVKDLTLGAGTVNGDGGMGMMPAMA